MSTHNNNSKTPSREPARTNHYKGSMTRAQAKEKLERLARRLGLTQLRIGSDDGASAARVGFAYGSARVERTCATQRTAEANLSCLVLWLEDRARNMERGIETFAEAFADSIALVAVGSSAHEYKGRRANFYTGSKSVEQSIEVFRSTLRRLGIAETDVKLTWNADENWARLRMRLPSGGIVEKVSRAQKSHVANVAALGLWLQTRTRNWERGIESMDLDRVFAGNLLPARVA